MNTTPNPAFSTGTLLALAVLAGGLVFARLGHYALWGDEALNALFAESVWETGDTGSVRGANLVVFNGWEHLDGLKNRTMPPLQYYLAAPFVGLVGRSAWAARLPFAAAGWAGLVLFLALVRRRDPLEGRLAAAGAVLSAAWVLYSRQGVYYGVLLFLAPAGAWAYLELRGRARLALLAAVSLAGFGAHYLAWFGALCAFASDQILFARNGERLSGGEAAAVFAPTAILGAAILWVWNPLVHLPGGSGTAAWAADRARLFWMCLRDMDFNEFGSGILVLAGLVLAAWRREAGAWRPAAFCAAFTAGVCLLSRQPVAEAARADARYLAPIIPLGVWMTAGAAVRLAGRRPAAAALLGAAAFATNLTQGAMLAGARPRATMLAHAFEFARPGPDPYGAAAAWIRREVPAGASVAVFPDYAAHPLMFHAPGAVYAWQVSRASALRFPGLPAVHYEWKEPPDFAVFFEKPGGVLAALRGSWPGTDYAEAASLPGPGRPAYKPEPGPRRFGPGPADAPPIRIFKKTTLQKPQ